MPAELCSQCALPFADHLAGDLKGCTVAQASAMTKLLINLAAVPVPCKGCKAPIFWVTHKNGKRVPYTPAGLNHFIDCPAAAQFGRNAQQ